MCEPLPPRANICRPAADASGCDVLTTLAATLAAVATLLAAIGIYGVLSYMVAHRSREIAVRVSIGATRWRIVRQLLMESVVLAVISGLLGLALFVAELHDHSLR